MFQPCRFIPSALAVLLAFSARSCTSLNEGPAPQSEVVPQDMRPPSPRKDHSVDEEPRTSGASIRNDQIQQEAECIGVLETFLGALAIGNTKTAFELVAPTSKAIGDPIGHRYPLTEETLAENMRTRVDASQGLAKFWLYRFGASRWESPTRFRLWLHFASGDNDETMIVLENGRWYIADPIHIIR